MPQKTELIKSINRARAKGRPTHVSSLEFTLNTEHIPENFLISDIQMASQRHLIFMSNDQRTLLSKAVTWYVDGTFSVVQKPFYQLFIIHAFVTKC